MESHADFFKGYFLGRLLTRPSRSKGFKSQGNKIILLARGPAIDILHDNRDSLPGCCSRRTYPYRFARIDQCFHDSAALAFSRSRAYEFLATRHNEAGRALTTLGEGRFAAYCQRRDESDATQKLKHDAPRRPSFGHAYTLTSIRPGGLQRNDEADLGFIGLRAK